MNRVYLKIYEKNSAFLRRRERLKKAVFFADRIAAYAIAAVYAAISVYAIICGENISRDLLRVFAVPAFCFTLTSLLRLIFNEKRPYERGVAPLFEKKRKGRSFPSRHLSSAAVIAGISFFYLPVLGVISAMLGGVLFYTRFACGWHFPRDLLGGALLGAACALSAFFI